MSATNEAVRYRAPVKSVRSYDARLRRELTHRRLVVAIVRRFFRVVTLHFIDASLIASVVWTMGGISPDQVHVRAYIPAIVIILLGGLNAFASYSPGDARRDIRRVFYGVCFGAFILACLASVPPAIPIGFGFLTQLTLLSVVVLSAGRLAVDQLVRQAYKRGFGLRKAVIIGNLDDVGMAIRELRDDRNIDQYLLGHITPDDEPDPASLGRLADAARILDEMDIQEVIVTGALSPRVVQDISALCFERGAALYVMSPMTRAAELRTEPTRLGDCTLTQLHPARLELPALMVKRAFDLVGASLLLLLLSPAFLLIAVLIKMDSPGPILHLADRIGLGGRPFKMYKFRSMQVGAMARELELAHLNIYGSGGFKIRDDPRVTKLGRILRRWSLDELPQLLNVLRGEMSLVGPRPPMPIEVAGFKPHHFEKLSVIPGMTGPWQVSGRNLITDVDERVNLERAYIRSWSLLLDAKILLRTFAAVVRGNGAY